MIDFISQKIYKKIFFINNIYCSQKKKKKEERINQRVISLKAIKKTIIKKFDFLSRL